MVAPRQVEIPFYRGIGRQRGRRFGALAQVIERTGIPFLRENIVPAAKQLCAYLLEFAAPEYAEVVSGRTKFKISAKSVQKQPSRKQLGNGNRKSTASRVIPKKSAKQTSRSGGDISTKISISSCGEFFGTNLLWQFLQVLEGSLSSWRCLVVPRTKFLSYYLTRWKRKLHRTWISNGSEVLRWFETNVFGFETEIFQESRLRNLQNQKKNEHKEEAKADEETEEKQEAPVPLVTQENTIFHLIFSKIDVYINKRQFYNSNGLYAHKPYICVNFKGPIEEYKGGLHCEGYDYEKLTDEIEKTLLSELFCTRRMKVVGRTNSFG